MQRIVVDDDDVLYLCIDRAMCKEIPEPSATMAAPRATCAFMKFLPCSSNSLYVGRERDSSATRISREVAYVGAVIMHVCVHICL
jgi:hypothetical protein